MGIEESTSALVETTSQTEMQTLEEREHQVIVHCRYESGMYGNLIRIWPTTFLIAKDIQHRSELVHVEQITIFPEWSPVPPNTTYHFTLIFSGLPKDCMHFDLLEEIPQEGGFFVPGIRRNETDVYSVEII